MEKYKDSDVELMSILLKLQEQTQDLIPNHNAVPLTGLYHKFFLVSINE